VDVYEEIKAERARQDEKWGAAHDDSLPIPTWVALLAERVGSALTAYLSRDRSAYRRRLVQTAALAVAAVESLDRQRGEGATP
jgi:hypothetical protein